MAFLSPTPLAPHRPRVRPVTRQRDRRRATPRARPTAAAAPAAAASAGGDGAESAGARDTPQESTPDGTDGACNAQREALQALNALLDASFDAAFAPYLATSSVLQRRWTRTADSFILRPTGRAKAVLHFIGGAFFGAAPHLAYRTLLERLCERGYCVVAAPFSLSMDYLTTVAGLTDGWERVETDLALEYGAVPVVGLGHSAGALFHALASSLFDDACPKAANVLISFNNRPIASAIPLYAELVAPLAKQSVALRDALPEPLRAFVDELPDTLDAALQGNPLTPARLRDNLLPTVRESRRALDQLLPLLRELSAATERPDGRDVAEQSDTRDALRDFYPPPEDVTRSIAELYAVRETLVVKFEGDALDDSEILADAIRRRGSDANVSMITLDGSHLTPLAQDAPDFTAAVTEPAVQLSGLFGFAQNGPFASAVASAVAAAAHETVNAFGLKELTALEVLIDEWIEAGITNDRL